MYVYIHLHAKTYYYHNKIIITCMYICTHTNKWKQYACFIYNIIITCMLYTLTQMNSNIMHAKTYYCHNNIIITCMCIYAHTNK